MVDHEFYSDVLGDEDDDPDNMMSFLNAAEVEEGVGMDDHELLPIKTYDLGEGCESDTE